MTRRLALSLFLALACPAPWLRADSISLAGGLTLGKVHVDGIGGGQITYSVNGEDRTKPLADLSTMSLDDETDFNAGESAYQDKRWAAAADGFARALAATDKQWLKGWIAPRLLDSANHANRFDAAVAAWIRIINSDPAAAAAMRPAVPSGPESLLGSSANELDRASKSNTGPARRLILGLLLDVQAARQDNNAAAAVARELQSGAPEPADGSIDQQARLVLARQALREGKLQEVIIMIDSAAGFTDPARQADALFIKAQALDGQALAGGSVDDWKDVALAYLRVYVHFPDGPASVHAAAALLNAARIEQTQLNDPAGALKLYQKLISEYNDTPEARQARPQADRLARH